MRNTFSVLIVEDEETLAHALTRYLRAQGVDAVAVENVAQGMKLLNQQTFDIILTDLYFPGLNGLDLLEFIKKKTMKIPVVIMTGHASLDTSIHALRCGAVDYLVKPVESSEILETLRQVVRSHGMARADFGRLKEIYWGYAPAMQRALKQVEMASQSDLNVLITGESGTGKEVFARAIYEKSTRAGEPFVAVNCGGLDTSLFNAELFGYKKGSFTGAQTDHRGYFEEADGGTLFLDEIGELEQGAQIKLLRALETGEFHRVGDTANRKADVRLIVATNRDLEEEVKKGAFRLDLFYRINILRVQLPPLRERKEDISELAHFFLARHAARAGRKITGLSPEALERIQTYSWPGNVRELEHAILKAVAFCEGDTLHSEHFYDLRFDGMRNGSKTVFHPPGVSGEVGKAEKSILEKTLAGQKGDVSKAAMELGINRSTLYRKVKKYGIDVNHYR